MIKYYCVIVLSNYIIDDSYISTTCYYFIITYHYCKNYRLGD